MNWIDARKSRRIIVALILTLTGFLAAPSVAADETRVIPLQHRPASEIIPLIRPLLGPDDVLSGTDYRLILRTSDSKRKEIDRLLAQLDVAPRRLRITVEQAVAENRDATSHSISGEAKLGNKARVILPEDPSNHRGLVVQKNGLRYTTSRRNTKSADSHTQTIMTLDGHRAHIRIGQSVPYVKKILLLSGRQMLIGQGIELQNVTTGFEVLPRVHGNQVHVEITPRLATLDNPATGLVNFQELATTVETKLGEWIDLGAVLSGGNDVQRAILESATTESGVQRAVRLKIE